MVIKVQEGVIEARERALKGSVGKVQFAQSAFWVKPKEMLLMWSCCLVDKKDDLLTLVCK